MKKYGLLALILMVGLLGGWFLRGSNSRASVAAPVIVRENSAQYKFVNPLLYVETDKSIYPQNMPLRNAVNSYISSAMNANNASGVSVYYRDLNSSSWMGVNEDEKYDPGSMLKVAVLMGYLNDAQTDPTLLGKQFYYTEAIDPGQYYQPSQQLKSGYYTVRQLLDAMIVDSDNTATKILTDNDPKGYDNVYKSLELPTGSSDPTQTDFMSAKSYSIIFRTLYNSTYVPAYISEQAMSLLSSTTFDKGLTAGVPNNVVVAHKFGEHTNLSAEGLVLERELHDCGIVYLPGKPYLLCIMTKGLDFPKLEKVIADLSGLVYAQVSK